MLIDRREQELARCLPDAAVVELDYGDAAFGGNGPDGRVEIGVERKKIGDLVNSIVSGRLSGHQLPGLMERYFKIYLVVEGVWRVSTHDGEVEVPKGSEWGNLERGRMKITGVMVHHYLSTLEMFAGIVVRKTASVRETAVMIGLLEGWWQKEWSKHKAHLGLHKEPMRMMDGRRPSLLVRMAAELPHIGITKALELEKHFSSVREMVEADEKRWTLIPGIGKITAQEVYWGLRKEEK